MSNEYDAAVAASLQPDPAQSARVGFYLASDTNPDAYAEAQRVARRTGVPVDTALSMPQEIKRQDAIGSIDFATLAKTSPATAALIGDVDKAKIAHDNVDSMTQVESALYELGKFEVGTAKSLASAVPKLAEGAWGVARAASDVFVPEVLGRNAISGYFSRMGGVARNTADGLMPKSESLLGASWYSGMQSLGLNALLLPMAVVSGGSAVPVLTGMGLSQAGQSYGEARDKGVGTFPALGFAASQGLIEAWTETFGLPKLLSILQPGKLAKKALDYLVRDQGGEQVAAHFQGLNDWAVLNPDKPFTDYIAERPAAAVQTALSTVFSGGGQVAVMKGLEVFARRNDLRVQQADAGAELLGRLNQLAAADKVLARDADTFEQFVAQAAENGPVQQVFIDGRTLMQSGVAEQVAAVSPAVATQLAEAVQTGGQIAIPVEEYAARIAPTDAAASLLDHLRTEDEGFSRAEAQTYLQTNAEELHAEVERVASEAQGDDAFKQSAEAVKLAVKTQLDTAARFAPYVNDAYAALVGNFYAVLAARTGTTPEAVFDRYTLKVGAERIDGAQFEQGGTLSALRQQLSDAGIQNAISEKGGVITVSQIVVPENERGAGKGTAAMQAITDYADRTGQHVALSPSSDFGGNKKRLVQFYKRFGFVENKGKNRAFSTSESMYRQADGRVLFQGSQEVGPFGPVLTEFNGDAQGAIAKLTEMKGGEAIGALHHPDIGDIDLVWGEEGTGASDGYGLAKLVKFHPEVLDDLQGVISAMQVTTRSENRVNLESNDHRAGVRLTWDNQAKHWLMTAFQKKGGGGDATRTDTSDLAGKDDTASLADASDGIVDQKLYQFYQGQQAARGTFNPATLSISLLKNADLSTFLHESGHFFLEVTADLASQPDAPESVRKDMAALLDWFGVKSLDEWHNLDFEEKRHYHEQYARGFEAYLYKGEAPSIEMQGLFQRFRAWLLNVYRDLKALNVELTPEVRGVFDRMLATTEQIQLAEQGRSMFPLFASPEQSGMTPEEFAAYQANGVEATAAAIQDMQGRGLRDMQWLHNARGRLIGQLQKDAKARRAEVQMDVRREVMSQPVYRAWQFLTGKLTGEDRVENPRPPKSSPDVLDETIDSLFVAIGKLGGISKAETVETWGIDPADKPQSGRFGKPLWRIDNGLSLDGMAEALAQYGYLTLDENGKWDLRELEDKFKAELSGDAQYSTAYDYSAQQPVRPGEQLANPAALMSGRFALESLRDMLMSSTAAIEQATPKRHVLTFDAAMSAADAFIGKPLTNASTGKRATVSKGTLGKMLSAKAAQKSVSHADHALAVANVDALFAHALLNHSHPDAKAEPTIAAIHRFVSPMIGVDGSVLLVKMTVKETAGPNEPNPLYSVEAIDVEKPTRRAPSSDGIERGIGVQDVATTATGGLDQSVVAAVEAVKRDVEQFGYGTQIIARLQALRMTAKEGLHPDLVAEMFGFSSGDELVRRLAAAPTPKDEINALTDRRMLEQYGELSSPEAIEKAADRAIHNDARARFVATEANALANATGQRRVLVSAAKAYAAAAISRLKVRAISPGQYASAEERAAKAAAKASRAGDLTTAAAEKRNQVLQLQLTRAAYDAQEDIDKGLRYLRKFARESRTLDADYADQIERLLERFELRPISNKETDRRTSLANWLTAQREAGREPDIPPELENEAFRTSYKNMTVEEFRGLVDTVKQIEHLGRLKHKLLTAADKRDFKAIVDEAAESIREHGGDERPVELEGEKGIKPWLEGLAAGHRKLASLLRQMDGGNDNGPLWRLLGRTMNESATRESVMNEQATESLARIYAPVLALKGGLTGGKVFIPEINASLTRGGRLAVALNLGNAANRQRLMDGNHWNTAQIAAIVRHLTSAEAKFVNEAWSFIDSLWPEIAAKEKRVTGREPEKVEAEPFTLQLADGSAVAMRGGYYPLKYDAARDDRAEKHDAAAIANDMKRGAFTRATTRRGHTKARVEEVKRPVRLDLSVITEHVQQVTHDIAWHEWLIDANRLIDAHPINQAIRDHYGAAVIRTIKDTLQAIATADVVPQTKIDQAMLYLRSSVARSTMGLSLTTALMQPFGLTQSMVRIGIQHVLRGMARWGGDVASFQDATGWIYEKSDFMRLRDKTFNRELHEINGRVSKGHSAARQVYDAALFLFMQKMQKVADVPTWIGAYEKARSENADDATAAALADQAVLDSQGGGQTKDMTELQRKHPFLAMFYSYFSVTHNLAAESTAATDFRSPVAVAGWMADMALLMVIPALVPALLTELLRGGGGDDDPEAWAKKLAQWQSGYLLGTLMGLREASGVVTGYDYAGPPIGRVITEIGKFGKQAAQGELDEALSMSAVRLLGVSTGLPTTQIIRSYRGWQAWAGGKAPATAILMGPPPRD